MNRRDFVRSAAGASLLGKLDFAPRQAQAARVAAETDTLPVGLRKVLDREISEYLAKMNAPGLGFSLTDLEGHAYVQAYGLEDLEKKQPLASERLFQIGSISKSMAAILVLQLVDEGKLDLHLPVMEYLSWLPWETSFGAVTTHHVLTHTTGLPSGGGLLFARGTWKHHQRYPPGERYFYSNMAFNAIGHLVELIDGRSYQDALSTRLLKPLGMSNTRPKLGGSEWRLQTISYIPAAPDRPYLRYGELRQAPAFHEQTSAGCVASTPADMLIYLRFLLREGVCDNGRRLITKESSESMTRRWVKAEEFGPTAGYGYGVAVDQDGTDSILLHTGGMVSFMSSIHLNLTRGIGAFASINAQQGYRPKPVTRFAVSALESVRSDQTAPMPASISVRDPFQVPNATEYAGIYRSSAGSLVTVEAIGLHLQLHVPGTVLPLQGEEDWFLVEHDILGLTAWNFERGTQKEIVGLAHGSEFYLREGMTWPIIPSPPPHWTALVGDYVNDDPWILSSTVLERNNRLFLDGDLLEALPGGSFSIESEKMAPDRVEFACEVNGQMHILFVNGTELRRFRRSA